MRVGIIGGGFMGEAFLRGLLRAGVADPSEIAVAEIAEARRTALSEHGVRITDDAESASIGADVVLVAVKPQDFEGAAQALAGAIPASAVLLSVAAGIRLADVQRFARHRASVRVMPNLPAAIGEGATVYYAAADLSAAQRETAEHILSAVSAAVVEVDSDDAIDLATAVHGSGPAYVYMMIEAMIESGVRLGMKRPEAQRLVLATVAGAARYALASESAPAELRYAVTSPGGTTAAAVAELEAAGMRAAFDDAIEAAYARAQELGE